MSRQITKELAQKMVKKLNAEKIKSRGSAHDEYEVAHEGVILGYISIRRASEKDKGHDYIPGNLHISPRQAKDLAHCPWSRDDYIRCMREKGELPPEEGESEDNGPEDQPSQGES
jgi:hypothetical protein